MRYSIASALPGDAEHITTLMSSLSLETENMMLEPDEVPISEKIEKRLRNDPTFLSWVAWQKDTPVGYITLERGRLKRNQGVASLTMGVLIGHRGGGIGFALMSEAIKWGKGNGLYRLQFDVRVDNYGAVELYTRLGFEIEGTIRRAARIRGQFVDKYLMSMVFD